MNQLVKDIYLHLCNDSNVEELYISRYLYPRRILNMTDMMEQISEYKSLKESIETLDKL